MLRGAASPLALRSGTARAEPAAAPVLAPSIPKPVPRGELPAWVAHYVGLPFVDLGRDRAGLDCWGLVRLVGAERFGVQMPAWDGRYPDCERRHMRAMEGHVKAVLPAFERISPPDAGDIVLVKVGGLPVHVGIVVAPGWMLHAEFGCDSIAEPILRPNRPISAIEGFYRWRGKPA